MAHNLGVRQAFRKVFDLEDDELIIPPHFCSLGAIGAVMVARENPPAEFQLNLQAMEDLLAQAQREARHHPPLQAPELLTEAHYQVVALGPDEAAEGYLGIDVGSISTNIVVINPAMQVLAREYLMTAGRPLEAVTEGLRRIGEKFGRRLTILGAATTGSGRYLTADFIGPTWYAMKLPPRPRLPPPLIRPWTPSWKSAARIRNSSAWKTGRSSIL